MKNFQNKILCKKAYALYLSVAFFFTIFSFGSFAYAETVRTVASDGTWSTGIDWGGYPTAYKLMKDDVEIAGPDAALGYAETDPHLLRDNIFGVTCDISSGLIDCTDGYQDGFWKVWAYSYYAGNTWSETPDPLYYMEFNIQDGEYFVPLTTPRVITAYPLAGSISTSTTVAIGAEIWNDSAEYVNFKLSNVDSDLEYDFDIAVIPLAGNGGTYASSTELMPGHYFGEAKMIGGGTLATNIYRWNFTVVRTNFFSSGGFLLEDEDYGICSDESASSTNPFVRPFLRFGCWVVIPSQNSVERFKTLNQDLEEKFPFAYAYEIGDLRSELFESAENGTTTVALTFKIIPGHGTSTLTLLSKPMLENVPFADTVKTILGWMLWIFGAEYIYYRVIRAHDTNTPA